MKWATFLLISIKLSSLEIKINIWTTCSSNSITDGESQQELGSQRLKSSIISKTWRTDPRHTITIMTRAASMMWSGLKIKNSLMLRIDLVIPSSEKSQLKRFLVLKEPQLILAINFNPSFRLHLWTLIQLLTLNKAKSFMRTRELLNGSDSGK